MRKMTIKGLRAVVRGIQEFLDVRMPVETLHGLRTY